ncbi:hypothetical protein FK268_05170 [Tsukamurella sputi]|uniref:Secreted protein n=1 Tax=Tsukamurella sputi TaxID=2591848 RepID=A0A5C5RVS6_9ACTN|nr:hypothetical protein [Tsukamurella sputi]TWS26613.1 hypothetical protein FK268_05170 [Tsukamurella sputi]
MTYPMFLGFLAALWLAAVAAEVDNRYRRLEDHADAGLGTDEFEGPRRYTRPTDRGPISNPTPQQQKAPVRSAKTSTGTSDRTITSQRGNDHV